MKKIIVLYFFTVVITQLTAQTFRQDKGIFKSSQPGFYQNVILKDEQDSMIQITADTSRKYFILDMSEMDLPNTIDLYKQQWHFPPISQGNTGTCWCFSTTSFLESEIYRMYGKQIKLSEMFTVYWEYVDKATRYLKENGKSLFDQGSEANALRRIYLQYGAVPAEAYVALEKNKKYYHHDSLFKEMKDFLLSVIKNKDTDEEKNILQIKSILNKYMGEPPSTFIYNGKEYTPVQFLKDVLKLDMNDYVDILSYKQEAFYKQVEYKVPDNWWHDHSYFNVPLDDFMIAIETAINKGYTVTIGGDVSEPGFSRTTQCALIPTFDIPSPYINDDARQFRFSNNTTQDDHGMHLVGYTVYKGKYWFLVKDSGSGSRNNNAIAKEFGYYFISSDYIRLKMMDFFVHKDAVQYLLKKFNSTK